MDSVGDRSPTKISAFRQNSRHFATSFTASEPSGMLYSSSIVPGHRPLVFRTVQNCAIGVSPVPHGRFSKCEPPRPVLQMEARNPCRGTCSGSRVAFRSRIVRGHEVTQIDIRRVFPLETSNAVSSACMLPCWCGVIGGEHLVLQSPIAQPLHLLRGIRPGGQFERNVCGAECLSQPLNV